MLVVLALIAGGRAAGLQDYASFAALSQQQGALRDFVDAHPAEAPLAYIALYAGVVSVSLPVGLLMNVAGGLLFGVAPGSVYAVTGASLGAVAVFLLARGVAGGLLSRRAADMLDRLRPSLERDGFSTLLAVRLLPVVPFWVVNIVAAVAGMRLAPFAVATLLGIAPTCFVLVSVGAGLGGALAQGRRPDVSVLFSAPVLLPLLALAAMVMAPVGWRAWRRRHA